MTTLNQTLECLLAGIGEQTGAAIKTEINNLIGLQNVDLQALQATVAAIQGLVDADPNTPGFQVGQNIVAQLVALGNRIDSLEASTVVAQLQVLVNSINAALAAEVVARAEADAALQAGLDALSAQYDSLSQQVTTIINNPTGESCDCEAIAAQITALETSLGGLTGTDAAQAAQIATLQGQIASLSSGLAAAVAAANAAAAAAATALATANGAAASVAALQATVEAIDTNHHGHHGQHRGRLTQLESFKAGVEAISCAALLAKYATGLSAGLAA
jgi:chromosome segregation ATPase